MRDDPGTDLHQLLPEAGQRPAPVLLVQARLPLRVYSVEKVALKRSVWVDSISLLIWEIDDDDGPTPGSTGSTVL